ncbi:DUF1772 domain-containing protein [Actinomadura sp. 9N407]|uniref:DUF1772 domain-containing protein n=1 Tax=Actinomadura sp. 9N407 TaxID=3375154 RepID=UPI0037AEB227
MSDHPATSPPRPARHGSAGHAWTGFALGAALVMLALVAGLNFTFAVAVMPNMAGVDDRTFVEVTQRFNENPVFPVSFTLALISMVFAVVLQASLARGAAVRWTIVALVLYGVVLAVTAGLHIPLNYEIDQAGDPDRIKDLAHVRDRFEGPWVAGNIVRTLFCTAAVAALARALLLLGRQRARSRGANAHRP